jgi:hypothetical protein
MKHDLGLFHLCNGFDGEDGIFFYGVEFFDIDFISAELCSVMFEIPFGENSELYAMSLDFDRDILRQLILKLSGPLQKEFIDANEGRTLPFQANLPQPVTATVIKCRLGEKQTTAEGEQFVPFIIQSIE